LDFFIAEYDAVDVGNVAVTGGSSAFHTVDEDGIIQKITVHDFSSFGEQTVLIQATDIRLHVACLTLQRMPSSLAALVAGHTTFFPGSSIGVSVGLWVCIVRCACFLG
jgi:hypothetical protein